jgi:hypothetical protein
MPSVFHSGAEQAGLSQDDVAQTSPLQSGASNPQVNVRLADEGGAPCTVAVDAERAVVEPPAFVAVTTCLSVAPASPLESVYVGAVAPTIGTQLPFVQRSQARVYDVGWPDHVPTVAESV